MISNKMTEGFREEVFGHICFHSSRSGNKFIQEEEL